jgi:hypothetical protein
MKALMNEKYHLDGLRNLGDLSLSGANARVVTDGVIALFLF